MDFQKSQRHKFTEYDNSGESRNQADHEKNCKTENLQTETLW